jgi:hypothetical protein
LAKQVVLRSYLRQRQMLIGYAGQHVQHMHKALEQMNVKLAEVVSDVTGVTGRAIIQAILQGEFPQLDREKANPGLVNAGLARCRVLLDQAPGAIISLHERGHPDPARHRQRRPERRQPAPAPGL